MAKDDLKTVAERIRAISKTIDPNRPIGFCDCMSEVANALDPPPDPEPEFLPGELVQTEMGYPLIATKDGYIYLSKLQKHEWPAKALVPITPEALQEYFSEPANMGFLHEALSRYAHLVVDQEQPPELGEVDSMAYNTPTEKRCANFQENYVEPATGQVLRRRERFPTKNHVWIVKPKENSNERQGMDA